MSLTDKIVSEFEVLERGLNGQKESPMFQVRKSAITAFQKLGIPSNRHEEWRYTHIKNQLPESLSIMEAVRPALSKEHFNAFDNIKATKLVFVNGIYERGLSEIIDETGVVLGNLKEHFSLNKEVVEKHFDKLVNKYEEHFSVLNTAFAGDGAFVWVKKNVHAKSPIFIIHVYDAAENFIQSRNLVIAETGSSANIVVDFQTPGAPSFYNHVSEIFVGANANINVAKLQTDTRNAVAVHTLEADVERDGKFSCTTITFEGKLIRNASNVRLNGENVEAHLNGLYYGKGESLIDNHILVDHIVPNCQSNQLYKGVLDDEAKGVFNGKIFVKQDAQKTNAFQSSKAILLSDSASVDSKPQLEIFADDVKCSHGAAIGQLSDNEVFYLKTRGIPEAEAKSILTYAFAAQIFNSIAVKDLKLYLDQKLKSRLGLNF